MTVTSVKTQATNVLKQVTAAANKLPTKPIEISSYKLLDTLGKKLVDLAKKDPPKAAGLVDLLEELKGKGLISMNFNTGPVMHAGGNAWRQMMNDVKTVLNNNAVTTDDRPLSPLMR